MITNTQTIAINPAGEKPVRSRKNLLVGKEVVINSGCANQFTKNVNSIKGEKDTCFGRSTSHHIRKFSELRDGMIADFKIPKLARLILKMVLIYKRHTGGSENEDFKRLRKKFKYQPKYRAIQSLLTNEKETCKNLFRQSEAVRLLVASKDFSSKDVFKLMLSLPKLRKAVLDPNLLQKINPVCLSYFMSFEHMLSLIHI
eukprot:TRINITY_DN27241_c0_g1_i1.p1 TRINITY_DN27241_c0_g1~~TRINITY_DN27241_c0_g1_i1.p1  ORF type:complete len:200 (+),score=9.94 TRINITY_DN27241_c0_g1_i1:138-737(+)